MKSLFGQMRTVLVLVLLPLLLCLCATGRWHRSTGGGEQSTIYLGNERLGLSFSSSDYSLVGLENRLTGYNLASGSTAGEGRLWEIKFLDGSDNLRSVDDRSCRRRSHRLYQTGGRRVLELLWEGVPLGKGGESIDVSVSIALADGQGDSEWTLNIRNRGSSARLWRIHFPFIEGIGADPSEARKIELAVPYFTGWRFSGLHELPRRRLEWDYPSCRYTMQFCSFSSDRSGFYLAAHDSTASHKLFVFESEPNREGVTYHVVLFPAGMGTVGMDYSMPFPIIVGAYRGDWYEASKHYRKWALKQPWCSRGPLATRPDIPDWYKEISLWYKDRGAPDEVKTRSLRFREAVGLPVALHWYQWHQIPFDDDYPDYFPPRPGFAETVRELQGHDIFVFPYVNGRLWDTDIPSWRVGIKGAAKDRHMKNYIERYPSREELAPMCPSSVLWQDTVAGIVEELSGRYHVDGVYLDQVSSARPRLCFDPSHGHPSGGGSAWFDGYRRLMTRLKERHRDLVFVTENNAEPLLDLMDGHLSHLPPMGRLIPLFQSVYSGYAILFGRRIQYKDLNDSMDFFAKQGDLFAHGGVPGWVEGVILERRFRPQLEYLGRLARMRSASLKYLLEGEMLRPLDPLEPVDRIHLQETVFDVVWDVELPAVRSTVWKARDGSLAVLLVNTVDRPVDFRYRIDLRDYGFRGRGPFLVSGGSDDVRSYHGPVIERTDRVPALGVRILEFRDSTVPDRVD
jgi:hypothetical protein